MRFNKNFLILLVLPFVLSGCIGGVTPGSEPVQRPGGLFRSGDVGENWERVTTLYTVGDRQLNFDAANITTMAFDPTDEKAIYLGTQTDGLFYSYDYGEGWFNTLQGKGTVNDVIVDPLRNCTIYAAVFNTIYKSDDCSRNWKPVYFEALENQFVTALAIDANNNNIVYAGTSGGSFIKSTDYGRSWDVLNRFEDTVKKIIIQNHSNSDILYVGTQKKGVFRSKDAGLSWEDLMERGVDLVGVDEQGDFLKKLDEERLKKIRKYRGEEQAALQSEYDRGIEILEPEEIAQLEKNKYQVLAKVRSTKIYSALSSDRSDKDALIYANQYGIFVLDKPELNGVDDVWKQLELLTPDKRDVIYSVITNPQNGNEIIYGTTNAFYHSLDRGVNWTIRALPTDYSAKVVDFSPDNKFLYLGAYAIQTQR